MRSGVAALLVGLWMAWRRERLTLAHGVWQPGVAAGALFALEFLLAGEGLRYTSAAHMVVFLYTAPIFAALGLHWWLPAERLAPLQWAGIALAFTGIVVAFFLRGSQGAGLDWQRMLWGDLLGPRAGGVGRHDGADPCHAAEQPARVANAAYQLVVGFALLVLLAWGRGMQGLQHAGGGPARLFQPQAFRQFPAVVLAAYLPAVAAVVFSFLTPRRVVALGAWLLAEPIAPGFLTGAVLVLAGVMLVSSHGWLVQRWKMKSA
ncbi:MAG: DMT family transporter [Paenacidovorax caeni]